jgi:hypothetical protein
MEMVAHDPGAAKRVGVPQSVGRDFADADKGHKFAGSSPKSREEHMARRAKQVGQTHTGREFGVAQSTVSRKARKQGFTRMGGA